MDFLIYELTAKAIHLGERAKGNLFKPCVQTIPYSAITGALMHRFSQAGEGGIKAVGFLDESVGRNRVELLTYSPRDRVVEISKIPLQVEFLSDVLATVLVIANEATLRFPERFQIVLGGMRSHGFGSAGLKFREKRPAGSPRPGLLRVRLPEEEAAAFGIIKVQTPVFGYLFKPAPGTHSGVYVRALFEGSRVVGPEMLLQPQKR
ncbi:MAG TPA: hypothetical protein VFD30_01040 [Terriglobia bacterium]|nr:hypothetical protein [Terriglobia bacterium]